MKSISNFSGYAALGVIVLFGTILSYIFFLEGIKRIGATKGSLMASIEPVVATVLTVLWLSDTFQIIDLIGFALIPSTVIFMTKDRKNKSEGHTD
ncbi:EamA family transporter [Paenibacillus sp. Soil750]|uniref:EamA family transporter n=1 Tax=Paenibacillus sp. Soil750 TaxID=1736398 RepID=UPI0006FAC894|nr:hypothetical protein ASL11_20655 [Paenibacillus sp. Soil750]